MGSENDQEIFNKLCWFVEYLFLSCTTNRLDEIRTEGG